MSQEHNSAKGRESYDSNIGNSLIHFFNRNVSQYPTEAGGPKFELIPVEKQKDIMVNVARLHAQQEYDRIMDLVKVLQKQAEDLKRRLDITDMVHAAKYDFQTYHGNTYWLAFETDKNRTILCHLGPNDWCTGAPANYEYICRVKWMGDYTWIEVKDDE
jgi:hypothetical protein